MAIYLLPQEPLFPPAEEAENDGLLAIGGDLSVDRLLSAYSSGIFPWFTEDGEPYWYSPDPRMILFPENLKLSDSLNRKVKSNHFNIKIDHDFEAVIRNCAEVKRSHEAGTWISKEFIEGFTALHHAGFAHSVESYLDGELAGGLYGVSIGKAFFGESMFFKRSGASTIAFVYLVRMLISWGFHFIDCQVETNHFIRLGAENIPRKEFLIRLNNAIRFPTIKGNWMLKHIADPDIS